MFRHGWCHRDDRSDVRRVIRLNPKYMTAGEGEFSVFPHADALRHMQQGRAVVEDAIGREAARFVVPGLVLRRWGRTALKEAELGIAEDHFRGGRSDINATLMRGPEVTWASHKRAGITSSLAAAATTRYGVSPLDTVRIAVHPTGTKET